MSQPSLVSPTRWRGRAAAVLSLGAGLGLLACSGSAHHGTIELVSQRYDAPLPWVPGQPGIQGNQASEEPSISADGRYVAFASAASNLVPNDTNARWDVFVRDRATKTTVRVSLGSGGDQGNGHSEGAAISADGRIVAFQSVADNLVPGDTNGVSDVFVRDLQTGETRRVSVSSTGEQGNNAGRLFDGVLRNGSGGATISGNGRFVAFGSFSSNLATLPNGSPDANNFNDVFVHDLATGETILGSLRPSFTQFNNQSGRPALSYSGQYLAWDTNGQVDGADVNLTGWDVLVRDLFNRTTPPRVASTTSSGARVRGSTDEADLSADGTLIAFRSSSTQLAPNDTNGVLDVFVKNLVTGAVERVSLSDPDPVTGEQHQGDENCIQPSISGDGRYVAFGTAATNLLRDAPVGGILLHDRVTKRLTRESVSETGVPTSNAGWSDLDATGSWVAFHSGTQGLVAGDTNYGDVYVRGIKPRSSVPPPTVDIGLPPNGHPIGPGTPGVPGRVTRRIGGGGHFGCIIRITISDPKRPDSTNNNRVVEVPVDQNGRWEVELTLDDCEPILEFVQICPEGESDAERRQCPVDGTPPRWDNGDGPTDGALYPGEDGKVQVPGAGAYDPRPSSGAPSWEWRLIGPGGPVLIPGAEGPSPRLDLPPGTHEIEVVVSDPAQNELAKRCTITVRKRPVEIGSGDALSYCSEVVNLAAQMAPVAYDALVVPKQPIPGAALTFKVNGEAVADPASYLPSVKAGEYEVEIGYAGSEIYEAAVHKGLLKILKRPTAVSTADVTVPFGTLAKLGGSLADLSRGAPLDRPLTFKVNGQTVASPFEARLAPGSYPIEVSFAGDDCLLPSKASATLTVHDTPGKITGGGSIDERLRNFGFVIQALYKDGALSFQGSLEFQDKSRGYNLHSVEYAHLGVSPDRIHGVFTGKATLNGVGGYTFTVWIEDRAEPGAGVDKFRIQISDPNGFSYDSSAVATKAGLLDQGGNIQIHKAAH